MKKVILLLTLLVLGVGSVSAEGLKVIYSDAIGADTNGTRTDVVYTTEFDISSLKRLWFAIQIEGEYNDTVFANDSFFVGFQTSFDGDTYVTHALGDTALFKILKGANDTTIYSTVGIDRDSSYCGNYGRFRIVHRNALANKQALTANVYKKKITGWVNYIKESEGF